MNLVIGIVYIVSDFVVTIFPKVTAKLVGVWLRTGGQSSSQQLSTTRELKHGIASKLRLRKTVVFPAQVAGDNGNMSSDISENNPTPLLPTRVVPMESSTVKPQVEAGCMDHNHDIFLKQNLDRSAFALPVEETIPVKRVSQARRMSSILSSRGQSVWKKDETFL